MPDPKHRGRPRLVDNDTTTAVNVRVPTRDYDRACSLARRDGTSVAHVVRQGLRRRLDDSDEDDEN